jgi:hypothetical protein
VINAVVFRRVRQPDDTDQTPLFYSVTRDAVVSFQTYTQMMRSADGIKRVDGVLLGYTHGSEAHTVFLDHTFRQVHDALTKDVVVAQF